MVPQELKKDSCGFQKPFGIMNAQKAIIGFLNLLFGKKHMLEGNNTIFGKPQNG